MGRSSKPRVVVVGAGMAGLSAAYRLHHQSPPESFELQVLEAGPRIGGRICTASIAGDQVELGATWIHGIEGSPIYEIAERIGALRGEKKKPWECQDGFPQNPTMVAEGGLLVQEALIESVVEAYNKAMAEVKGRGDWKENKRHFLEGTVGSFVREGLDFFLLEQGLQDLSLRNGELQSGLGLGWDLRSLQEAVFHMLEDMERIATASNSLFDLDLDSEKEYEEFPGLHITIAGGYSSVLKEMASSLPAGTVQLEKKVQKVLWNHSHPSSSSPVVIYCEDGSIVEADHVILTMSLGVLKTVTSQILPLPTDVCRSVDELRGGLPNEANSFQLFEPALPLWKLQAISRVGFGVVDKLFLQVDPSAEKRIRSFIQLVHHSGPAAKVSSSIPRWMRRTFSICPIYDGSDVLLCWLAGAEAMEMEGLSDEEIIDGVVATLASFGLHHGATAVGSNSEESSEEEERRSLRRLFRGVLRSRWATDPLCKGSYTYVAAGASGMDIETLAEPLPRKLSSPSPLLSSDGLLPISRSSSASLVSSLSLASSSAASSSSSDHEEEDYDDYDGGVAAETAETMAVEEKPLQLLFAGEATHRHLYSTTHGAFLSGAREADRLLQHYHFAK